MRGRFLVLEGVDGAGKSTQAARLVEWLEGQGRRPLRLREPGGTPLGEALRELLLDPGRDRWDPRAEALLFFAARAELLSEVAMPALAEGRDVVCDRFTPSTLAYQGQTEELAAFVLGLDELVVGPERQPALVIVLDLPVAESLARAARAGAPDAFENRGAAFQEAVRTGYRRYAARYPARTRLLPVAGLDPDAVAGKIRACVAEAFGEGFEERAR
ncbi:MAG TPA: dTMP kinase [Planctomycetota bacterium]